MESSPVERVAAEFVERIRSGQSPTIDEYRRRYPDLAGEIDELFPMLAKLEKLAPQISRPDPVENEPGTGDRIGPYLLGAELGRGGMAVVFDATDVRTEKQVAVKVMSGRLLATSQMIDRFDREVRSASRLHHTHIVPVLDSGMTNGIRFLVMERINGASLASILREVIQFRSTGDTLPTHATQSTASLYGSASDGSFLTPEFFLRIARLGSQVAEAVSHAHQNGVFHRDIKPSNILLDIEGNAWVTDFGLAKTEEDNLTQTGDIVGTPRYMAPERLRGSFTPASDIFSIGATMYELLTLRPAFDQSDRLALIRQIEDSRPIRLNQVCSTIPDDLEVIVNKAMSKDPTDRYRTAEALAEDLKRFIQGDDIRARRPGIVKSASNWIKKYPVIAAAVTSIFLVLTVGLAFSTHSWRRANRFLEQSLEETARANRERDRAEIAEQKHAEVARHQESLAERARESIALIAKLQQSGQVIDPKVIEAIHRVSGDQNVDLQERLLQLRIHNAYLKRLGGRRSVALSEYQQITAELEQQQKQNPDDDRAVALLGARMSVGFIHTQMGRTDAAIQTYLDALDASSGALTDESSADMRDVHTRVLHNLGYAYVVEGRYAEAEELYREVIAKRRELLRSAEGEFRTKQENSLAQVYGDLAFCLQKNGRIDESLQWGQQCLRARQEIVEQFPTDPIYRDQLAKAYNHLADAHRVLTRNLFKAVQGYAEGIEVRGDLVTEFPRRVDFRRHRANDYTNLGSVWTMLGDYRRAIHVLQLALADYSTELAIDEQNANARLSSADQLLKLGRAHLFLENVDQSGKHLRSAIDHAHRCVSEIPTNRSFQRKLGEAWHWHLVWLERYGSEEEQLDGITQMVESTPEIPSVLECAAIHLMRLPSREEHLPTAIAYASRALELNDSWKSTLTLGIAHLRSGNLDAAEQRLKGCVRRSSGRSRCQSLLLYAQCLQQLGESERANACYGSALQTWLKTPYMHRWRIDELCQLRQETREILDRRRTVNDYLVDAHLLVQRIKSSAQWLAAAVLVTNRDSEIKERGQTQISSILSG